MSRKFATILSTLLIGGIFTLSVWGRTFQRAWLSVGFSEWYFVLLLPLPIFTFFAFRQKSSAPYLPSRDLVIRLVSASILLALSFLWLIELPIEAIHPVKYAALTALLLSSLGSPRTALLVVVLVASLDEGIQHLIPDRFFDPKDLLLDLIGGAVGVILVPNTRSGD